MVNITKNKKIIWYFSLASFISFYLVVIILGFVTPGYNHLRDTISQLVIRKYGFIQKLNFINLSAGVIAFFLLVYGNLTKENSRRLWIKIMLFLLIFLAVITIFPTEQLKYARFFENKISFSTSIHFTALIVFFLLSPFGIFSLSKALVKEPDFKSLAAFTAKTGYLLAGLCYLWTLFFISGIFDGYKGIFQKVISLITGYWFLKILFLMKPMDFRKTHPHTKNISS